jgi:hypothetical protein
MSLTLTNVYHAGYARKFARSERLRRATDTELSFKHNQTGRGFFALGQARNAGEPTGSVSLRDKARHEKYRSSEQRADNDFRTNETGLQFPRLIDETA